MAGVDVLKQVQASLVAANIGQITDSSADWMIYRYNLPDATPTGQAAKPVADRAICLYETPGRPPLEAWKIDYPGFQVRVRGTNFGWEEARNKIQAIFEQLHANEPALGTDWVYFYGVGSGPMSLGRDTENRPSFVWNFRAMRNRVPA